MENRVHRRNFSVALWVFTNPRDGNSKHNSGLAFIESGECARGKFLEI